MKLVRNYLYNVGYQLLSLLTPIITVPYVARILGPEGVGINSYTNSIMTYFVLVGTIGIPLYANREIAYCRDDLAKRSKTFWEIVALQFQTIFLAIIFLVIYLLFVHSYRYYTILQSFWLLAGAIDISWLFQGLEDFKRTVLRNTLVKLISLIAIFVLVRNQSDLGTYILLLSVAQFIGNLTLWPYVKSVVSFVPLSKLNIYRHLVPTLSLFVPQVAIQIYNQVNKTMLGSISSVTASGYFDYSDRFIKIILTVVTATGIIMLPRMSNLFARGEFEKVYDYLYKSFSFISAVAFPGMFGISAIATSLAPWYFGTGFSIIGKLLIFESPIIIFIAWSGVLGQQFLMPTKQVRAYTISVTIGAVINILLNLPLILMWGAVGAIISTVISEGAVTLYQLIYLRNQINIGYLFTDTWKYLIAAVIMFTPTYILNINMSINALNLFLQILVGVLLYIGTLCILQPSILNLGISLVQHKFKN